MCIRDREYTYEDSNWKDNLTAYNGKEISYKYNNSGIRTEKTVNGVTTKYYLSGDGVTLEDNGTDKIYYTYDADGDLISMNLNGKEYFYINRVLSLSRNFNFYLD